VAAAGADVLIRLVVVVGLAAVLAGCGSASSSSLEDAADATAAETSRFEMSYRFTGSVKSAGELKAAGLFDYPNERGLMTVSGSFSPWGDEVTFEEFRLIGRTGYTRWTVKGKSYWVKDDDVETSSDPAELLIPFPGSPTKPTDVLTRVLLASDEKKEAGKDQVRGTETSHYRARVDLRKLEQQLPEADRPEGQIEYAGDERYVPVELWIDDESRLRRITLTEQEAGGSSAMTVTVELYDYGVEFEVEPPPAGELISQEEFDKLTSYGEGWTSSESGEGEPLGSPEQVCEWARDELPKKDADEICTEAKAEAKKEKK
jgi:hypothetical protein